MHTWASSSLSGTPTAAPSGKHEPGHSECCCLPQDLPTQPGEGARPTLPAGLTCLKEAAAGMPSACLSSFTSCQALRASQRLMNPGEPFTTANTAQGHVKVAKPFSPEPGEPFTTANTACGHVKAGKPLSPEPGEPAQRTSPSNHSNHYKLFLFNDPGSSATGGVPRNAHRE